MDSFSNGDFFLTESFLSWGDRSTFPRQTSRITIYGSFKVKCRLFAQKDSAYLQISGFFRLRSFHTLVLNPVLTRANVAANLCTNEWVEYYCPSANYRACYIAIWLSYHLPLTIYIFHIRRD